MSAIDDIVTACRIELADCPDFVIKAEIPRVARTICEETNMWSEDLPELTLTDNAVLYALTLPDDTGLVRVLSLRDPDNTETVKTGLSYAYDEAEGKLFVATDGRSGDTGVVPRVALYPVTIDATPECISGECRDALEYGVMSRLFIRQNMAWTKPDLGVYYKGLFRSEIAKKKIKLARGSRVGSLTIAARRFV
jgi:hypothetical protein